MNLWLTPDLKPVFSGIYFPPEDTPGHPGLKTVGGRIADTWVKAPEGLLAQAEEMYQALVTESQARGTGAFLTAWQITADPGLRDAALDPFAYARPAAPRRAQRPGILGQADGHSGQSRRPRRAHPDALQGWHDSGGRAGRRLRLPAQSEPVAFFSYAAGKEPASIDINWPDGTRSTHGFKAGTTRLVLTK